MRSKKTQQFPIALALLVNFLLLAGCSAGIEPLASTAAAPQTASVAEAAGDAAPSLSPQTPLPTLSAAPVDYSRLLAEAQAALDAGQPEQMQGTLSGIPTGNETPAEVLLERAALFEAGGYPEAAIQDISYVLVRQPARVDLLVQRAALYHRIGQRELALADLNVANSIEPGNLAVLMARAVLLLDMGDPESALDDLESVGNSQNRPPEIFEAMGRAYLMQENYYEASVWLTQGIVEDVDNVNIRILRGTALLFLNNTELALGDANLAITRSPESVEGYALRGAIYLNLGRWEEAERDFQRAYELDPAYIDALYGMAQAQLGNRNTEAALAALEEYLSLASPAARNYAAAYALYVQISEEED